MATRLVPVPEEVHAALDRILASPPFANATRSQRFLRYVVEHSLCDKDDALKEYSIAVEVFDRPASYDPSIDATVRVEAGRLRSRLRDYYNGPGKDDCIVIEVPKGGYHATFEARVVADPVSTKEREHVRLAGTVPAVPPAVAIPEHAHRAWRWVALAAAVLALVPMSFWVYWRMHPVRTVSTDQTIVLAILPFANQTGDAQNNYLTEGLTDNLIRQISELHRLRVVARAAVENVSREAALHQLGATAVLTGELQKNPAGRLVLNSELSNGSTGTVLRSSQFYPEESDLRPVQSDIIQDVLQGLAIPMDSEASSLAHKPFTSSPLAYQEFLHGDSESENGDAESLLAASKLFQSAIQSDPNFAQAYASLAGAELELGLYFELPLEHFRLARSAAKHAIALDPSLADAHGILGLIHLFYDWDYPAAQAELAQADRREVAIWHIACTAHLLDHTGNQRHAEEDLQQMLEFNPRAPNLLVELGCVKYYAHRYDESLRSYQEVFSTNPQNVLAAWGMGRTLGMMGRYSEALQEFRGFFATYKIEPSVVLGEMGYIQALSGDRKGAMATIAKLQTRSRKVFIDPYFIAIIYLGLKDRDATYKWLDRAYSIHSPFLISIATDPKWSDSQADPRLQALWNRMTAHKQSGEDARQASGSM